MKACLPGERLAGEAENKMIDHHAQRKRQELRQELHQDRAGGLQNMRRKKLPASPEKGSTRGKPCAVGAQSGCSAWPDCLSACLPVCSGCLSGRSMFVVSWSAQACAGLRIWLNVWLNIGLNVWLFVCQTKGLGKISGLTKPGPQNAWTGRA